MKSASILSVAVLDAALVALLSACAGVDASKPAAEAKALPEYRTGSHLPIRNADPQATDEERERAAEQVRALQRAGNPKWPRG
jgi:type IV pilus biogenesis protein CpaD/CtpE